MSTARDQILDRLRQTLVPGQPDDIVAAGLVRALSVSDGKVGFVLEPDSETAIDLAQLQADLRHRLEQIDWVTEVDIVVADPAVDPAPADRADGVRKIGGVRHVVLVGSGKGGVGKSTVAANLAMAMVAQGLKVGLLDADIYGPSQPRIMGTDGRPVSYDGTLIPIATQGLKLMSLGLMTGPDQALIWRGPILHDTLSRLLFGVRWAPLDVLLIDLPPGTGDVPLSIAQLVDVDGAVLVSTPQELSRMDLRRAMDLFRRTDTALLGLIENMSTHICPTCGAEDHVFGLGLENFAHREGVTLLGKLPLNSRIAQATDCGVPLTAGTAPDAEADEFRRITAQLLQRLSASA